jgi:O-antigen ligase
VENILPAGRRRRFMNGVILAVLALVTAILLVRNAAAAPWFAVVFVLVLLASLMVLQARDRT